MLKLFLDQCLEMLLLIYLLAGPRIVSRHIDISLVIEVTFIRFKFEWIHVHFDVFDGKLVFLQVGHWRSSRVSLFISFNDPSGKVHEHENRFACPGDLFLINTSAIIQFPHSFIKLIEVTGVTKITRFFNLSLLPSFFLHF